MSQRLTTNEDFRDFLLTPSQNQSQNEKNNKEQQTEAQKARKEKKEYYRNMALNKMKNQKKKDGKKDGSTKELEPVPDDDEEDDSKVLASLALKYRDRAKERRESVKTSELEVSSHLNGTLNQNKQFGQCDNSNLNIFEENKMRSIEESKYLGGDIEHTHLVKGLDYSLLDKVRDEMKHTKVLEKKRPKITEKLSETSIFARKIMEAFFAKPIGSKNDATKQNSFKFMFSRQSYVYPLGVENSEFLIPTTIISSALQEEESSYFSDIADPNEAVSRISSATSYLQSFNNAKTKGNPSSGNFDSKIASQSIYDDIGTDYKIEYEKSKLPATKNSSSSYFDDKLPMLKAKREMESKKQQSNEKQVSKLSKLKMMSETTGYDECYPDFVEIDADFRSKKEQKSTEGNNKAKKSKNHTHFDNEWKKIQKIIEK